MDSSTRKASSSAHPSSQYHHYVPQFLLKSFAHKYRHKKNKPNKKKIRATELVVNCLKLDPPPPIAPSTAEHGQARQAEIIEAPVKRTLGQQDMYRDSTQSKPAEQQLVETMLSRLESDTSVVVRKINKAFDEGKKGVTLTRSERNLVRKFLFLMKYRGPVFFHRYNHETVDGYTADDRDKMVAYMKEKHFTRPLDVWLHNIRTVIELDMDTVDDLAWMAELPKKMYPGDANWAMMHIQGSFMAFVTPDNKEEDFLLTDNCYHIFEGPSNLMYSRLTGVIQKEWQNLHEFAPIAPRLMVVFRMNLLRDELAGKVDDLPDSLLNDLPIKVAKMDVESLAGPRKDNRFFFPFYRITTDQVDRIHAILLDNASSCSTIVFKSKASLKRTLESYMTRPDWDGKRVYAHEIDTRLSFLKTLVHVLKDQLGSTVTPVWEVVEAPNINEVDPDKLWAQMADMASRFVKNLTAALPDELPPILKSYTLLGGTKDTLGEDLLKSSEMLHLRIQLDMDTRAKGWDEGRRQAARDGMLSKYVQSTPHRMWMYVKSVRAMNRRGEVASASRSTQNLYSTLSLPDEDYSGSEDVLAKYHRIFDKPKLNRLMYFAMQTDVNLAKWPGETLAEKLFGDIFEAPQRLMKTAFHSIPTLENSIRPVYDHLMAEADSTTEDQWGFPARLFGKERLVEMATRAEIRQDFAMLLHRGYEFCQMDDASIQELSSVFFGNVFPDLPNSARVEQELQEEQEKQKEQEEDVTMPDPEEGTCQIM